MRPAPFPFVAAGRSRTTPTEWLRVGGMRTWRRTTPRGCSLRGRARFVFVGAVREPPVLKGRQSKPWIPAFAGMTGFRGVPRRRGNPRRRLDVVPCQIKGTPGLTFRRHSGEGRNPEPARAAKKTFPANPYVGRILCVSRCFSWLAMRAVPEPPLRGWSPMEGNGPQGQPPVVVLRQKNKTPDSGLRRNDGRGCPLRR